MRTEDASERLHLSLIDLARNYANPNPGVYTFDDRALGKGTWVVLINTGLNWQQFPEVITSSNKFEHLAFIYPPGKTLYVHCLADVLAILIVRSSAARITHDLYMFGESPPTFEIEIWMNTKSKLVIGCRRMTLTMVCLSRVPQRVMGLRQLC